MHHTKKDLGPDLNLIEKTLSGFVSYYNHNIPDTFPRASVKALQLFKAGHAELFKDSTEWTIERHRKKLMDWLTANKGVL